MKVLFPLLLFSGLVLALTAYSDDKGKKLPAVNIRDMAGNPVNTEAVSNDGNPVVIAFWGSWCKHCKSELNAIAEVYDTWQEETGVKVIAVSVDDQKTANSVEPMVNAAGWEFEIWMDTNGDFKRALGISQTPHSFLLDGEGYIVYAKSGYAPGDEDVLYEQILALSDQ